MLALFITTVAGLVGYLWWSDPADLVRAQLAAQIKATTGRELVVKGETTLFFFPSTGLKLTNVTLRAPDDLPRTAPATVDEIDVRVRAWPLLSQTVIVDRLILRRPNITVALDERGRHDWLVPTVERASPPRPRPNEATRGQAPSRKPADEARPKLQTLIRGLAFDNVEIIDADIRVIDARDDSDTALSQLSIAAQASNVQAPMAFEASLRWREAKVALKGEVMNLARLMLGEPVNVSATLQTPHARAGLRGVFAPGPRTFKGTMDGSMASARRFASWLGVALPATTGYGAAAFKGRLEASPTGMTLRSAQLTLDDAKLDGMLALDLTGQRAKLTAQGAMDALDLNTFVPLGATDDASGATKAQRSASAPRRRATWSDEPLALGHLQTIDVDATLTLGRFKARDLVASNVALAVALRGGRLALDLTRADLYGGSARGGLVLDGGRAVPTLRANVIINAVQARPLLKDAAQFDWLSGRGRITFDVRANAFSVQRIVETLAGRGRFDFDRGAIEGYDASKMLQQVGRGQFGALSRVEGARTPFVNLSGSVTIARGVMTTRDLFLRSAALDATATGTVSLPPRRVDLVLRPKIKAQAGDDLTGALAGLDVPVRFKGPWSNVRPSLDGSVRVRDPDKLINAVKKLSRKFKGRNLNKTLDRLLGGSKQRGGDAGQGEAPRRSPQDLLDQFLR